MEDCRVGVRTIAGKLRKLLDEGGRTYRGMCVYSAHTRIPPRGNTFSSSVLLR